MYCPALRYAIVIIAIPITRTGRPTRKLGFRLRIRNVGLFLTSGDRQFLTPPGHFAVGHGWQRWYGKMLAGGLRLRSTTTSPPSFYSKVESTASAFMYSTTPQRRR